MAFALAEIRNNRYFIGDCGRQDTATIDTDYGTTLVDVDIVWSGNFGWIIDNDDEMDDVQPIERRGDCHWNAGPD